ncbi:hypothetical protein FHU41_002229 [Psychromicrobium silvestre]|uniref:YdhG-like domain-containing protein n=1 Tax=Psychromicrobium silvestre TaxID=1645614 RepID=A0A7Y9LUS0_9MICC|nr:DUF1801 domain-containing protein [Psychromicrobium silvestre]NYE95979.1 hypothetical protein [Psychromicrobium silvestre]
MAAKSEQIKTVATEASVQEFIDSVSDPVRRADAQTLLKLMTEVTGHQAVMWGSSIIGFGSNHYKYESGREGDQVAVGFSPRKGNLAFYGLINTDSARAKLGELGKHKTGVGCLYVTRLEQIELKVLKELIRAGFQLMNQA